MTRTEAIGPPPLWIVGLVALATAAGCGPEPDTRGFAPFARVAGCREGAVAPATAAPAVGLWANQGGDQVRVTAGIGHVQPPSSATGALRHRVETLESLPGAPPLRAARDSAAVLLNIVPPYNDGRTAAEPDPAATYVVSERVVLASYESCALTNPEPLVRYFRRDGRGRVMTDVMLHRQSVAP